MAKHTQCEVWDTQGTPCTHGGVDCDRVIYVPLVRAFLGEDATGYPATVGHSPIFQPVSHRPRVSLRKSYVSA